GTSSSRACRSSAASRTRLPNRRRRTHPSSRSRRPPSSAGSRSSVELDQAQIPHGGPLFLELGHAGVDAAAGELVDLETLDDLPFPVATHAGEGGDQSLRDT